MSDEFDSPSENYSPFWPLLIVLVGLFIWSGYQVWAANSQRSNLSRQFQNAVPTINEAQNIGGRYVALMKDLVQTAQTNQPAAQIVKDAIQAGLIHVNPGTNSNATAVSPSSTPASDATK